MKLSMTLTREDDAGGNLLGNGSEYEVPIVVTYTWHRASRGATDGRYGPPIEPDEPAYAEIDSVTHNGTEIKTTEAENKEILLACGEDANER